MGPCHIELRTLDGKTAFLHDAPLDLVGLRACVAQHEGLPSSLLRLTSAGRELHDSATVAPGSSVHVLLRLLGGKGGFGAMLRTAGARGVKTTNFDACRDLNGRRLRHVNAEASLREWDMQAQQRELKRQEEAAKKGSKAPETRVEAFDEDEYDEMLKGARDRVADALAAIVASTSQDGQAAGGATSSAPGPSAAPAQPVAPAAGGGAATSSSATAAPGPEAHPAPAAASGKRRSDDAAADDASSSRKAAKLNAAFDPLAALGGSDEDSSDGE